MISSLRRWLALALLTSSVLGWSWTSDAGASSTNGVSETPIMVVRAGSSDVTYVLASTACTTHGCLRLYRSNMQGSSFNEVSLPPKVVYTGSGQSTLESLSFATPSDGFADVGPYDPGVLYATTNAGTSWHRVHTPKDLAGDVRVTGGGLFVTTAICGRMGRACDSYRVWHATLAAKKWTLLPTLFATGPNLTYYGPSVAAYENVVWELQTGDNGDFLWTSTNHGRTFVRAKERFPELVSVSGCELTPMSTSFLWAECPTGMQVSFWHSSDGGVRWQLVNGDQHPFMGTGGGFFDPLTDNEAIIDFGGITHHPNLYRVVDGGARFISVSELSCNDAAPLIFFNARDGLVLCTQDTGAPSRLLRTNDGGVTWTAVTLPRE